MKKIMKLFKTHSPYLVILTLAEICLSVVCTLAFVYSDKLSYEESELFQAMGIEKLLESIYSSTWWALILLLLGFIALFSLASMVFKKLDYLFFSIGCWVMMLILAINLNNTLIDNITVLMIGVPILLINAIAYQQERNILNKNKKNKEEIKISKFDCIGYTIMVILIIAIMLFLINAFRTNNKKNDEVKPEEPTTQVVTTEPTTKKITTKKTSKK